MQRKRQNMYIVHQVEQKVTSKEGGRKRGGEGDEDKEIEEKGVREEERGRERE